MKLKVFFLLALLAGCAGDGCSGERFTVVLPKAFSIEETAELQLAGEAIGFVESVEAGAEEVRATVRVQDIAKISDADLFLPLRDSRGKRGLRIVSRQGAPLRAGATVNTNRRGGRRLVKEAPQTAVHERHAQARSEAPSETANRRTEKPAAEREAAREQRMQKAIERAFKQDERFAPASTPGAQRFQGLGAQLDGKNPAEIAAILNAEGEEIALALREEAREARKSGDLETAKALRRMESQLMRLRRQSGRLSGDPSLRGENLRHERRGPRQFERE